MAVSDLSDLLAAVVEKVAGPAHLSYLGGRPGWSPDREAQTAGLCVVCGHYLDDRGRDRFDPALADLDPSSSDPIAHGELATWVCEGCGRTRSRSQFGGLYESDRAVLDSYEDWEPAGDADEQDRTGAAVASASARSAKGGNRARKTRRAARIASRGSG
jgi:hypothetical protein